MIESLSLFAMDFFSVIKKFILTRNVTKPANISATNSIMKDGKGACKSNDITATPIREAQTTSGKQQSKCEQELPKKPRSAMKKGRGEGGIQHNHPPGTLKCSSSEPSKLRYKILWQNISTAHSFL